MKFKSVLLTGDAFFSTDFRQFETYLNVTGLDVRRLRDHIFYSRVSEQIFRWPWSEIAIYTTCER